MQPASVFQQAARCVIHALAPEGRLQGDLHLVDRGSTVAVMDYYIEDVHTRVPADGPLLKARLRGCVLADGARLRLVRYASFTWVDDEIRLRCVHLFKAQPFNMLIRAEGVLSYEDVMSASATPLWGSIDFHRTTTQLDRLFDRQAKRLADDLIKRTAKAADAIARRRAPVPAFLPPAPFPEPEPARRQGRRSGIRA